MTSAVQDPLSRVFASVYFHKVEYVVLLFLLWRVSVFVKSYSLCPKNVSIIKSSFLGEWLSSIYFLFSGSSIITKNYVPGIPYAVPTPENYLIMVSSASHIKEINSATENQLSLRAAVAEDLFQYKYTLNIFTQDVMRVPASKTFPRAIGVLLPQILPALQPAMLLKLEDIFVGEIDSRSPEEGWSRVMVWPMVHEILGHLNGLVVLGEEFTNDSAKLRPAMKFPQDLLIAGEFVKYSPAWLAPLVAGVVTKRNAALRVTVKNLIPLLENRLERHITRKQQDSRPLDCIQLVIDTMPSKTPWTLNRLLRETISLWTASIHAPALTLNNALYDLCAHPEYLEPLRQEAQKMSQSAYQGHVEHMPLLDSFLKESSRINPIDSISLRRKAKTAFTFSDGMHVPQGSIVCLPQRAVMADPAVWPSPELFDGFRHVAKFTEPEFSFPIWGLGKDICPGRFYASSLLKMIIGQLILKYDFKLADPKASRSFAWRSGLVPKFSMQMLFRKCKV